MTLQIKLSFEVKNFHRDLLKERKSRNVDEELRGNFFVGVWINKGKNRRSNLQKQKRIEREIDKFLDLSVQLNMLESISICHSQIDT